MDPEQNTTTETPATGEVSKKSSTMLIVGAVVILVLIAWLALMKGGEQSSNETSQFQEDNQEENPAIPVAPALDANIFPSQGTSDEIADIEADLDATDLNLLNEVDQI